MNKDTFQGQFKQMQGKFKTTWGRLTDDQWAEIGGNRDMLLGKIQEVYGRTKEEAERELHDFERQYCDTNENRAA